MKLTATEKRLVELYRAANTETRKKALAVLKGDTTATGIDMDDLISNIGGLIGDTLLKK